MTGSSSAVNRDDPRASPRPSPRMKTGSFRKGKGEPIERKDNDSIGSDTRSRSGSMSSVDSSDQLQEGRGKFEKVFYSSLSLRSTEKKTFLLEVNETNDMTNRGGSHQQVKFIYKDLRHAEYGLQAKHIIDVRSV